MGGLGGDTCRSGEQLATRHLSGHRLDERSDRDEIGVGADELRRDRSADLGGDVFVSAYRIDVVGERRAVEQLTVEVPGDQSEGGEDGPGDDQHPHEDGHPSVSARHAPRETLG